MSCTPVATPRLAKYDRLKVTLTDEKFYSLAGRRGLLIETKDGHHYFIGCQNLGNCKRHLIRKETYGMYKFNSKAINFVSTRLLWL